MLALDAALMFTYYRINGQITPLTNPYRKESEMTAAETTITSPQGDRRVTVKDYGHGDVLLKIQALNLSDSEKTTSGEIAFLEPKEAYELVDFITEHLERPEEPKPPTSLEKFQALPIGGLFTWGKDGITRIKIGPNRYLYEGDNKTPETYKASKFLSGDSYTDNFEVIE